MTKPKWHEQNDEDLRPEPVLYRLEAEINGQNWSLRAVLRMQGSPLQDLAIAEARRRNDQENPRIPLWRELDSRQGRRPMTELKYALAVRLLH